MSPSLSCLFALVLLPACEVDEPPVEGLGRMDIPCPDDDASDDSGATPGGDSGGDDSGGASDPPVPWPPDRTTYRELNVAWFQWILSQPRIGNPGFDPTGAACASGQSGDIWFLAGSFNQNEVERTCTIPADKAILVPVLTDYTSCYFGDAACTENILPTELDEKLDGVTGMFATIDGYDMGDPVDYRVRATEFSATLPAGNVFQAYGIPITGLVEDLYGGGYWMLFDPLPPGEHSVTFGGVFPDGFSNDNTYTLTVE